MTNYRQMICRLLAILALAGIGGCFASGPEPSLEIAYSGVGAQVK
jgi:hypothetical protein